MKAILLLSLLYVNVALGQLTYTSNDHYSVGADIEYEVTNLVNPSIDFAQNGENIDWDFSDLTSLRKDTLSFIDPNSSGYKTSYCFTNFFLFNCQSKFDELTNIAVRSADSLGFGEIQTENIVRHFKLSDDEYAETMLGITAQINGISVPVGFEFEEPDVNLRFPFTYGSVDSSESRLVIDLSASGLDAMISRDRRRVNTVDGYGSLTTPAGTYNAVLKMKTVIFNDDITQIDTLVLPISTQEVEYKWFAKGYSGPVMTASGLVIGGNKLISEVRYQKDAEVSSITAIDLKNEISISPNPFVDFLNIDLQEGKIKRIELYDTSGRLQFSDNTSASRYVLSKPLPGGVYMLKTISESGATVVSKVVKQ